MPRPSRTLIAVAAAVAVAATAPPAHAATPKVCRASAIQDTLVDRGKLEREAVDALGQLVNAVRCQDFTGDGVKDALFGVASGGTAGNTRWGILLGRSGSRIGRLAKWVRTYGAQTAVNRGAPEVGTPNYGDTDPNCCPSSFTIVRHRWNGTTFKTASTRRVTRLPDRFARDD